MTCKTRAIGTGGTGFRRLAPGLFFTEKKSEMPLSLRQTDTAALDGAKAACSALSVVGTPVARQATHGGTAGTGTPQVTISAVNGDFAAVMFETAAGELDNYSILAGNWTLRLNVTTANANFTLNSAYVCRVNSSGVSQGTIASATGLNISLGTTGVKSTTLSGSAQTRQAGDRIYIVLGISGINIGSFNFKPDQLIDTPLGVFDPALFPWTQTQSTATAGYCTAVPEPTSTLTELKTERDFLLLRLRQLEQLEDMQSRSGFFREFVVFSNPLKQERFRCLVAAASICSGLPVPRITETIGRDGADDIYSFPELAIALLKLGWAAVPIVIYQPEDNRKIRDLGHCGNWSYPSPDEIMGGTSGPPAILVVQVEGGLHCLARLPHNKGVIDPAFGCPCPETEADEEGRRYLTTVDRGSLRCVVMLFPLHVQEAPDT